MEITLSNVGRRFNKEWVFQNINYNFSAAEKYAVLGANGSGKSTLLSILLSSLTPSSGEIKYFAEKEIPVEKVYQNISFAAPYLDLIEEFTLLETIRYHFKFKRLMPGLTPSEILNLLGLHQSQDKALKYFSSGMKQRTKLALAFCADTPVLILDEPTSNLDTQGVDWYLKLIENFAANKLVVVGSNQPQEYDFCKHHLNVTEYK